MINFSIIIIIFILLVTQKILLLNEESLILLCFIIFVYLGISKLGVSFKESLKTQSKEIKKNLIDSLKKLFLIIFNFQLLSKNSRKFLLKINLIKKYYKSLILLLNNYFVFYNQNNLTQFYSKKLIFLNKTENQTIKLLSTIIINKLNFLIRMKYFFINHIKINQFLSFNYISIRESIHLINRKK